MCDSQPHLDAFIGAIEALAAGNQTAACRYAGEGVIYRMPGKSPLAGEYRGIEGWSRLLSHAMNLSSGSIAFQPKIALASGEDLVVYARLTASRNGRRLGIDVTYLLHFDPEGKIQEGRTIPSDMELFDAFWG